MSLHQIFGLNVQVLGILPMYPSPTEDAKRIVRQGMADITLHGKPLVDPGPAPGAATHAIVDKHARVAFVSRDYLDEILRSSEATLDGHLDLDPDIAQELWYARTRALRDGEQQEVTRPTNPVIQLANLIAEWVKGAGQRELLRRYGWQRVGYLRELDMFDDYEGASLRTEMRTRWATGVHTLWPMNPT